MLGPNKNKSTFHPLTIEDMGCTSDGKSIVLYKRRTQLKKKYLTFPKSRYTFIQHISFFSPLYWKGEYIEMDKRKLRNQKERSSPKSNTAPRSVQATRSS